MWGVSNKYKEYIAKRTVEYEWTGTIVFSDGASVTFDNENVDQNKSRLTRQIVKGENLELGGVFAGELILGLRDSAAWNISDRKYDFLDAVVTLNFVLKYPDNTDESVLCGTFVVNKAQRTYHTVTLTAYDNINKLNEKLGVALTGNFTPYDAISTICTGAGITLGMTRAQVEALPNGTRDDLKMSVYKKGTAYKKMLGDVCTIIGANAVCDRYNRLILVKIGDTPVRTIGAANRYSSSYADYNGHYSTLYYALKNGEVMDVHATRPDVPYVRELAINIGKNSLLEKYESQTIETILRGILLDQFYFTLYSPCNVVMPTDPSLDVGDMVSIIGGEITGLYVETIDTSVVANRKYYEQYGGNYVPVTPIGNENPSAKNWYVKIGEHEYVRTMDTTVNEITTYYEKPSGYREVVPVGTENPSEEGWYVLGTNLICTKIEMPLYGQMKLISEAGNYELEIDEYATKKEQEKQEEKKEETEENERRDDDIGNLQTDVGDINEDMDDLHTDVDDLHTDVDDLRTDVDDIASKTSTEYVAPYQTLDTGIADGGQAYALRFRVTCNRDGDTVAFHAMMGFTVSTTYGDNTFHDCNLTIQYLLDDTVIATGVQTYTDGNQILTMNGKLTPTAGEHTFDVKFAVAGGSLS